MPTFAIGRLTYKSLQSVRWQACAWNEPLLTAHTAAAAEPIDQTPLDGYEREFRFDFRSLSVREFHLATSERSTFGRMCQPAI